MGNIGLGHKNRYSFFGGEYNFLGISWLVGHVCLSHCWL